MSKLGVRLWIFMSICYLLEKWLPRLVWNRVPRYRAQKNLVSCANYYLIICTNFEGWL